MIVELLTAPFAVVEPLFLRINAFNLANPHAVLELGLPPDMVGLYELEYAPIPLLTTDLAVGTVIFLVFFELYFLTKFLILVNVESENEIFYPDDLLLAEPFGLTLLPFLLSFLGAGVCAADFLPLLFINKAVKMSVD